MCIIFFNFILHLLQLFDLTKANIRLENCYMYVYIYLYMYTYVYVGDWHSGN